MKVIKEGYVLRHVHTGNYVCTQNTTTPKMYATEESALKSNEQMALRGNDGIIMHDVYKVYLVLEGKHE